MKKSALITELLAIEHIDSIIKDELRETKPDGSKKYALNVLEVVENSCAVRDVYIIVQKEGTKDEAAYFEGGKPARSLRTEQEISDTDALIAKQKEKSMIELGLIQA